MSSEDEYFAREPEEPKKKRRKKRKRGRVLTVDDMPRKVREEFRTDQKAEKFIRLLGEVQNTAYLSYDYIVHRRTKG